MGNSPTIRTSGPWRGKRPKLPLLDEVPTINLTALRRAGLVVPGRDTHGTLRLAQGASADFSCTWGPDPNFRLTYADSCGRRVTQDIELYAQHMRIVPGPAVCWWFYTEGVRTSSLHQVPGGRFAPRRSHGLWYQSQCLCTRKRLELRIERHRAKYGPLAESIRPRRITTVTWERWLDRLQELRERLGAVGS